MAESINSRVTITRSDGKTYAKAKTINYEKKKEETLIIATATDDQQLDLGQVTSPDFLYIETDQDLTITLNTTAGDNEDYPVSSHFVLHGAFTDLYISNNSGSTATVTVFIAEEPA